MDEGLLEVVLHRPVSGEHVAVPVETGHIYIFAFDLYDAEIEAKEGSLKLAFGDGGAILLKDFFPVAEKGTFLIQLEDGTQLDAKDVADVFMLDLGDFPVGFAEASPIPGLDNEEFISVNQSGEMIEGETGTEPETTNGSFFLTENELLASLRHNGEATVATECVGASAEVAPGLAFTPVEGICLSGSDDLMTEAYIIGLGF